MATTYAVVWHTTTAPDGTVHSRTSIHRRYTHALALHSPENGWIVTSWHQSADEASDALSRNYQSLIPMPARVLPVSYAEQLSLEDEMANAG